MVTIIPQAWLTADMPDGTHIQLVVPEPQLEAMLHVLKFNKALSVSYAWQPRGADQLGFASITRSMAASNVVTR